MQQPITRILTGDKPEELIKNPAVKRSVWEGGTK